MPVFQQKQLHSINNENFIKYEGWWYNKINLEASKDTFYFIVIFVFLHVFINKILKSSINCGMF